MRVRVKICGLRREEDVEAAVEAGADAVGLVVGFPASPRNLTPREASSLRRSVPPFVSAVLVTGAETKEGLESLVEEVDPDAIQIYGPLTAEEVREAAPSAWLIKPIPAGAQPVSAELEGFDAVLLDSPIASGRLPGGSGVAHDWGAARRFREMVGKPLILAGGLSHRNVGEAIRVVRPFGVDVSSGVEVGPGVKSRELIRAFIRAAIGAG
jgi:phosphoribosylanthranilate isomerase